MKDFEDVVFGSSDEWNGAAGIVPEDKFYVSYPDCSIQICDTEGECAAIQREFRVMHRRNPITGEAT
jgi:hypothetical protein